MRFTTSINANYLSKAMVLAESLKKYNPNAKFTLALFEDKIPLEASDFKYFDDIVLAKDLGWKNVSFEHFIFQHSVVEACTAIKGQIFQYMLDKYEKENLFGYLDPDIEVFSELIELEAMLKKHSVVLTPHLIHAEAKESLHATTDAVMDNELCALKHGAYNLGFLAISRKEDGPKFIEWWNSRLQMFCYDDIPNGIFTDQKWCDLAPCFFDVYILKHPGYNMAPWNVSNRTLSVKNDKYYVNNDFKLRFFHFSGFDSGANEAMIKKYVPNNKDCIFSFRDKYVEKLHQYEKLIIEKDWFYDFFRSGEKIERESRLAFRGKKDSWGKVFDPFLESNKTIMKF